MSDDSIDEFDLIDRLMIDDEEPTSFSDAISTDEKSNNVNQTAGEAEVVPDGTAASDSPVFDTTDVDAAGAVSETGLEEAAQVHFESIGVPNVDLTAFQSMPFDDVFSNGVLFVSIVAFIVGGLYVIGVAMKLACHLTGGGRITIRRGVITTIFLSVTYALAAWAADRFSSGTSPFYTLGFQLFVGTLVLALLLWQNPIRAFATGILASILQAILLFGFFAATFILIGKFVPTQKLNQLAQHTQTFTDSLAKDVLPGDEEKARRLLSVKSLVESPTGHASGSPKVNPVHEQGLRSNPFVD